jgi:hypothetical protein
MRRTYRTLNDYEMQRNAGVGLFTRPSIFNKKQEAKQVDQAYIVFFAGIGGVFIGMALLYLSIRLTAIVSDKINDRQARIKAKREKK